jgi:hypothetical protein
MMALAVVAAGAHVLAATSPALAEQAAQQRNAGAEMERAIVPAPTAASDGLPAPALAGGIVLAFAVGLGAGQVRRRRRAIARIARRPSRTQRRAEAHSRRVPAPAPAPPPPEPAAPAEPVVLRPPAPEPAPAPPPPEPQPAEPRLVVPPPPAPAPPPEPPRAAPEPPRRAPEPFDLFEHFELFETAPQPDAGPLGRAPERPSAEDDAAEPVDWPLGEAALPPEPDPDAPMMIPARRFARAVEWPEEAQTLWTCEIDWKAGYRKSAFRAMAAAPGASKRHAIAESPQLRWALMSDPETPTPEFVALARALMGALEAAGWERIGPGGRWYAQRFLWRGKGEPGAISVPDVADAEPPAR